MWKTLGPFAQWGSETLEQVEEDEDGTLPLVENHCPICAAASFCQGFCRAEKAVFQNALGSGTSMERDEHIVSGGRRCTYIVRETGA